MHRHWHITAFAVLRIVRSHGDTQHPEQSQRGRQDLPESCRQMEGFHRAKAASSREAGLQGIGNASMKTLEKACIILH
jgi:hypothetical protein